MTKRIGLIVPSSNSVMEVDFYRNIDKSVNVHTSRMYLVDTTVKGEEEMLDMHFPKALKDIATVKPELIVFGCTSAGALRGNDYDKQICSTIEEKSDAVSVSVIKSVRERLEKINPKNLLVATPYIDALNEKIKKSLEDDGTKVKKIIGLGIDDNFSIALVEPNKIAEFVIDEVKKDNYDAVFISCTNFRAMEARGFIEEQCNISVITSNQIVFEKCSEILGCDNDD